MNNNEKSWLNVFGLGLLVLVIAGVFLVACWPSETPPAPPRPLYSTGPTITKAAKPSTKARQKKTKNDPRFDTCTEAIAAGYGFYMKGVDPEYVWYKDSDGDGWVCE